MEKFDAVVVNGGRKFRGEGYLVPGEYTSRFGYAGSGVCPLSFTDHLKVWDPKTKTLNWVNAKFVEDREVTPEVEAADFAEYADSIINSTWDWCRAKSTGDVDEVNRFAYNVLRKNHPEMVARFCEKYHFKVDVAGTVASTITWAFGLGYRADKATRIAFRALSKKGLVGKDGFVSAWHINLDLRGAGKYADRYVAA